MKTTDVTNQPTTIRNTVIGTTSIIAGWESQTYLQRGMKYFLNRYVDKQLTKFQAGGYKPYFEIAIRQQKFENNLNIININEENINEIKHLLKYPQYMQKEKDNTIRTKIISGINRVKFHILRQNSGTKSQLEETAHGKMAFFRKNCNAIVCNFDKYGAASFHEMGHKQNSISKNPIVSTICRTRNQFAQFGVLGISICALLTNKKKNKADEKFNDKIKNNCGVLTFLAMLPLTFEELLANYKGNKIAKRAGVNGDKLKKVKQSNKLSAIAYCTNAIIIAISAWGGNKIRDYIYNLK